MPLVRKLNLGSNFPRKMLHSRLTAKGIATKVPRTSTSDLTINLCMSHQRMKSENGKLTHIIENNQMTESRSGWIKSKINNKVCLGKKLWTENAVKMLNERNTTIRSGKDAGIKNQKRQWKSKKRTQKRNQEPRNSWKKWIMLDCGNRLCCHLRWWD